MIVDSQITGTRLQGDGRSYVSEAHTFDDASVVEVTYLASLDADTQALLAIHAAAAEEERTFEQEKEASNAAFLDAFLIKEAYFDALPADTLIALGIN